MYQVVFVSIVSILPAIFFVRLQPAQMQPAQRQPDPTQMPTQTPSQEAQIALLTQQLAQVQHVLSNLQASQATSQQATQPARPHTPMMPTASDIDGEPWLFHKGSKIPEPEKWDGSDITKFHIFKHKTREYVLASMPFAQASSEKGMRMAALLLTGAAYEWYIAVLAPSMTDPTIPPPFSTFEGLFHKLATRFGVYHQDQNARQRLRVLTTKPWTSDYHSYFTLFQSIVCWIPSMDATTMRNEFMFPLSDAIKTYVASHSVETWEEAHHLISNWIINKGQYNQSKVTAYYHTPAVTASGPTPMEIGAVAAAGTAGPSAARPPHASKLSPAEFWRDKQCLACGEYGHSKNYRGCRKHKDFNKKLAGRSAAVDGSDDQPTYAAAVAAATPAAPPATPRAAPPSAPPAASSTASSAEASWRADMETKMAIVMAALKE